MTNCHQELGDLPGVGVYISDLQEGIEGLRLRGWDRKERDVFALLLQRVATVCLLGDGGQGLGIPKALTLLKEAEINLQIFIGEAARPEDADDAEEQVELDMAEDESERIKNRKFGPQVENAGDLLAQIQSSIKILQVSQPPSDAPTAFAEEIREGADEYIDRKQKFEEIDETNMKSHLPNDATGDELDPMKDMLKEVRPM